MTIDPLSLLGVGESVIRIVTSLVRPKIIVIPKRFKTSRSDWEIVKPFSVCNRTEEQVFDVQVVIWPSTNEATIELSIDDQGGSSKAQIGQVTINTEYRIIEGERKGRRLTLVQVGSIAPKSCKKIYLKFRGSAEVRIEAVNFSREPSHISVSSDSVALPFKLPFDMTIKSSALLMKREK